jgi:hypothetical protein
MGFPWDVVDQYRQKAQQRPRSVVARQGAQAIAAAKAAQLADAAAKMEAALQEAQWKSLQDWAKQTGGQILDAVLYALDLTADAITAGAKSRLEGLLGTLEFVLLAVTVYDYLLEQRRGFKGLEQAFRDGWHRFADLSARAAKLREALITIFVNLSEEEAKRFVKELKAKAPQAFWDVVQKW